MGFSRGLRGLHGLNPRNSRNPWLILTRPRVGVEVKRPLKTCGSRLGCLAPNPREKPRGAPLSQIIEVRVHDRRDKQRQHQAEDLASDDRNGHRSA